MSNHHDTVSLLFIVKSPYLSLAQAPPQHRCHLWAAPLPTHGSPRELETHRSIWVNPISVNLSCVLHHSQS